jgi:hypothetical protein
MIAITREPPSTRKSLSIIDVYAPVDAEKTPLEPISTRGIEPMIEAIKLKPPPVNIALIASAPIIFRVGKYPMVNNATPIAQRRSRNCKYLPVAIEFI